jgi:hypothetical protein
VPHNLIMPRRSYTFVGKTQRSRTRANGGGARKAHGITPESSAAQKKSPAGKRGAVEG